MPIDLPDEPDGDTQLLDQPDDPPTLTDISNAVTYNHNLLVSHQVQDQDSASSDDIGRGVVYQTKLVQAQAGENVAPPWFAPALAAAFAVGLAPLTRVSHKTHNLACGDGRTRRFLEVPFVDGTLPTEDPHNLPALLNVDDVNALTGPEVTSYLQGYNLPFQQLMNNRKRAIRSEIGCTAAT